MIRLLSGRIAKEECPIREEVDANSINTKPSACEGNLFSNLFRVILLIRITGLNPKTQLKEGYTYSYISSLLLELGICGGGGEE